MKSFLLPLVILGLFACKGQTNPKTHLPSQVYHYTQIDTATLTDKHAVYVPVYSHIYTEGGTSVLNLGATLSIRNTSFSDTYYVIDVLYYGSQGELIKRYLDSAVIMKPMTSIEFVVERIESSGGAGANFVVKWGASKTGVAPLIQTVMIDASRGVSFVTNGVEMIQPAP